jgi:hypothetical protein
MKGELGVVPVSEGLTGRKGQLAQGPLLKTVRAAKWALERFGTRTCLSLDSPGQCLATSQTS